MTKSSFQLNLFALSKADPQRKSFSKGRSPDRLLFQDSQPDPLNATPLHYLCFFYPEKTDLVRELLDDGADPNAQDRALQTPFHYLALSAKDQGLELAKILFDAGAKQDPLDQHQRTPFSYLLRRPSHPLTLFLQSDPARFQQRLHLALEKEDEELLQEVAKHHPKAMESFFYQALCQGHNLFFDKLLSLGVTLSGVLFQAISNHDLDTLAPLIELGLDPFAEKNGVHPFHYACQMGATNYIEHYLHLDKKLLTHKGPRGESALHLAGLGAQIPTIRLLIDRGLSPHEKDHDGRSLVHYSCQSGDIETVQTFLHERIELYMQDNHGLTPFQLACQKGQVEIIETFLEKKLYTYKNALEDLIDACQKGDQKIAETLLTCQIRPPKDEEQLLNIAVRAGQTKLIEFLLEQACDPNRKDSFGRTPLHHLCQENDLRAIQALLRYGADLEATNRYQQTPLDIAFEYKQPETIQLLLESGASTHFFHFELAYQQGYTNILRLLLEQEYFDPESTLLYLTKSLYHACNFHQPELVQLLLEYNADPNVPDPTSRNTPLYLACKNDSPKTAQLLLEYGANPDHRDESSGNFPLHLTCQNNSFEISQLLLEKGASPNRWDKQGCTPLHYACQEGDRDLVELLLSHQADPDAITTGQQTPLNIAIRLKNGPVIELLHQFGAHQNPSERSL